MEEEGNRRSKEAVRNSIRTYGVKVMDPASLPLKKTKETESKESVSRFSEKSLHSHYEMNEGMSQCCKHFFGRIPYATLLASVICFLGISCVGIATARSVILTNNMLRDVFEKRSEALESFYNVFLGFEIVTAVVAALTLIMGFFATGDTRETVCKGWRARIGGRVCCALLMGLMIILFFVWMVSFWLLASLMFVVIVSNSQCIVAEEVKETDCLNIPELNILFPGANEKYELCYRKMKLFCKDYVEKVGPFFFVSNLGIFFVILSLVLFLICLSANYARIRCQAKYQELNDLRDLQDENKDRF